MRAMDRNRNARDNHLIGWFAQRLLCLPLLLLVGIPPPAIADPAAAKDVGGVVIYMGVMPAEIVRQYPRSDPEAMMHGGPPSDSGEYHVMVALFDARSDARISNAEVSARVYEIGLGGEEKKLDVMKIANAVTYGNYFPMQGKGPFRIALTIRVPGKPEPIKTTYEHWHY